MWAKEHVNHQTWDTKKHMDITILKEDGWIPQLIEHLHAMQEDPGSNPHREILTCIILIFHICSKSGQHV